MCTPPSKGKGGISMVRGNKIDEILAFIVSMLVAVMIYYLVAHLWAFHTYALRNR